MENPDNEQKPPQPLPHPPQYRERDDITDIKVEIGKFQERLGNLEKNAVTREQFANWKLDSAKWVIQLAIPLLAVALGFGLSQFLGK